MAAVLNWIPGLPHWIGLAGAAVSAILLFFYIGDLERMISVKVLRNLGEEPIESFGHYYVPSNLQQKFKSKERLLWIFYGLWILPAFLAFFGSLTSRFS